MNVRTGNIGSLQGMSCIAVLSYGTPLGRPKLAGQGFRNPQNVQLTGREPCQPCIGKRHRVPTELKHNVRAQSWTQLSGSGLQSLATRWYDSSGLSQGRGCSRTVPVPCRRRHGVPTELKHNVRAQPWTQLSGLSRDEDAREIEPAPRQAQTWVQRSQSVTRMLANRVSPVPEATWGSDRTQAQCASSTVDTAQRSQSDEDTREPRRKNSAPPHPPPPSAFVQNSAPPPHPPVFVQATGRDSERWRSRIGHTTCGMKQID
jgi:hypothetical protein